MRGNPFPGTREFLTDEHESFFGRRDEVAILSALVQARRLSLLFAQSGAGKTSLINAGLKPELSGEREIGRGRRRRKVRKMYVLPVAEVGGLVPSRLAGRPENVFVFSALYSLFPDAEPDMLAGQRLAGGIAPLLEEPAGPEPALLVFDQFEKLFTQHLEQWHERLPFFEQVAGALERHPGLHVLFSMREDFIAELTPYAGLLPGHLRDRYRLERLRREPALAAVRGPAARAGCRFDDDAAEELVDNLRRVQAGRARSGAPNDEESLLGEFVEPVHLQIVCHQLWNNLKEGQKSIAKDDLLKFGDVDEALHGFYEQALAQVLARTKVDEYELRDWFETTNLITPARTRGLVYRDAKATAALPNTVIDQLVDAYLIRGTQRGSDTWYELAHDRLVEPILTANREWRSRHLKPVTVAARAWEKAERDPRKLYSGAQLAEEKAALRAKPAEFSELEREFIEISAKAELGERRRRRRQLSAAVGVAIVLAVALGFAGWNWLNAEAQKEVAEIERAEAVRQRLEAVNQQQKAIAKSDEAEEERKKADIKTIEADKARLAEQKQREKAETSEQKAIAARNDAESAKQKEEQAKVEALGLQVIAEKERTRAVKERTRAEKERTRAENLRLVALAQVLAVRTVGLRDDRLAALLALQAFQINRDFGGKTEDPDVYNALLQALQRFQESDETVVLRCHDDAIRASAISADGSKLASGSDDGEILLFDLGQKWDCSAAKGLTEPGGPPVQALTFDPESRRLVAGGFDGSLRVWDDLPGDDRDLAPAGGRVFSVTFRPGSQVLAAARLRSNGVNGAIELWDLAAAEPVPAELPLPEKVTDPRSLAFSPDGSKLAAAGGAAGALLWSVDSRAAPTVLPAPPARGDVRSVAFSHDGRFLAAGTVSGIIAWWEMAEAGVPEPGARPTELVGHAARVEALAFHRHRYLLASASFDRSVRLWDLAHPDALPVVLRGRDWMWSVAFRPGAEQLVSSGNDRTLHLWSTSSRHLAGVLCGKALRPLTDEERQIHLPAEAVDTATCPERGE